MEKLKRAMFGTTLSLLMVLSLSPVTALVSIAETESDSEKSELSNETGSGLVINEICASNKNCYKTETGESPDWIELYNAGTTAVNLDGVGLSDNSLKPYKFSFPQEAVLLPDEYCLIICDDTNSCYDQFHAGFKISASGESVFLTASDGTVIDHVSLPELDTDTTYGRLPNGSGSFVQQTPSPRCSNNDSAVINSIAGPLFSVEGGFYDDPFELTLSTDTDNKIYYTLDGSDPCKSDTAIEYQNSISIYDNTENPNKLSSIADITLMEYSAPDYNVDKGITVRAVCRNNEGQYSRVITNNYFVNKQASYYNEMKVIAISTDESNFFNPETGIYVVGNKYEEWKNSDSFDPELNILSNKNPTNYNMVGKEWERPCNIQVFEQGNPVYSEDVGIRISGQWSTAYPQKSLTLYAGKKYGNSKMKFDFFDGTARDQNGKKIKEFKRVTLRNGGNDYFKCRFRDELNQELAANLEFGKQADCNYIVFIDGEFWGLYSMKEKIDENYIESHYGCDSDNITIVKKGMTYEGSEAQYNDFIQFWDWAMTADMKDPSNYQRVCDTIDINGFIDFISFENYILNWDCLENPNNWRVWRVNNLNDDNYYSDGKWRFILFDTEQSCWYNAKSKPSIDCFEKMDRSKAYSSISSLFYCLFENDQFKQEFYNRYREIVSNNFNSTKVAELIDKYDSAIKSAASDTFLRFDVKNIYEEQIGNLRSFYKQRSEYALKYLEKLYQIPDTTEITTTVSGTTTIQTTAATTVKTESTTTQVTASSTLKTEGTTSTQAPITSIAEVTDTSTSADDKHIATDNELCEWAVVEYKSKNGQTDVSAEITSRSDDMYEITLKDKDGNIVDVYRIDPVTGGGSNAAGEAVDLPKTGNNSMTDWLLVSGAFMLLGCGLLSVNFSGFKHRKEDKK